MINVSPLTGREIEVVSKLASKGYIKSVALDMAIKEVTVLKTLDSARSKLGLDTNVQMIYFLAKKGMI